MNIARKRRILIMMTVPERLAALRAAMAEAGCDAFLMPSSDPHSSEYAPAHYTAWEYFSGFSCENSNLVVMADQAAMWVDGRFFGAADAALAGTGIDSMHMSVKGVPTVEQWLEEKLGANKVLGYCAETMPLGQMRSLQALCDRIGAKLADLPLVDQVWTEDRPSLPVTEAWLLDPCYAGLTPAQKLEILRGKLREQGCTAMLVTKLDCVAWLLNLRAADVENTPYALAFCYVDLEGGVLFTDPARVPAEVVTELGRCGVTLRGYGDMPAFLEANTEKQTVLVDPASLNAALYNAVRGNDAYTVVEGADPIVMLKAVKNETELEVSRQAHLEDGAAMVRFQMELEERLAAGEKLRETDIDPILHKYRSANEKFITESFGTIAAYGSNAAMMHYAPRVGADAEIGGHGFLLVDSGATYYHGTTDITRTYPVGALTGEEKLSYTHVLRCHIDMAMAVWKEGATGGELDMLARQPLWHHMLDYRCGTGHSVSHVGAVHEGPHSLRPHNAVVFEPGMVITDEPGIYEEGNLGIRIENELVCVEAGESEYGRFLRFEPLMYVPIELSCALTDMLSREEKEWINSYHALVLAKLRPLLTVKEAQWLSRKCAAI